MLSIDQLSALSMDERMAAYRDARDQNRAVGGHYRQRASVLPNTIGPADRPPVTYPEGVYQTVTAIMAGIWDDTISAGRSPLMTSETSAQEVVDQAAARRLSEL